MIDYTNCNIDLVSAHHVGNKTNGEDLFIAKTPIDISNPLLRELLVKYFLSAFTSPEMYSFTFSNEDFSLNPIFNFVTRIFDVRQEFHINSINLAKHLYETSLHPNIKEGDFYVVFFSHIMFEGSFISATGFFKSENKQPFLKLVPENDGYSLQYEDGINIEKMDKGCLVLDVDRKEGFKVMIVDKSNKTDAQYWRDGFLKIKPVADEYHNTNNFLALTKKFVTGRLPEEMSIEKADQIDLLNRSVSYFKNNERFDKVGFEEEVFVDKGLIQSFQKFEKQYVNENDIEIADDFDISAPALKKHARAFKSVLKLDKNFHIYIHGDRELIKKGIDPNTGKKFYQIYYDEET